MYPLRRWIVAGALVAVTGCATDWNCGCRHHLFGRLTGRSRDVECCPVVDEPCCDGGMMGGSMFGAPEGVEVFSPPAFDAMPAQPMPPTSQPMAKPMPYTPNGR